MEERGLAQLNGSIERVKTRQGPAEGRTLLHTRACIKKCSVTLQVILRLLLRRHSVRDVTKLMMTQFRRGHSPHHSSATPS